MADASSHWDKAEEKKNWQSVSLTAEGPWMAGTAYRWGYG